MYRRKCTTALVICSLLLSGCSIWREIDHRSRVAVEDAQLVGRVARVTSADGVQRLNVDRVEYPLLSGRLTKPRLGTKDRAVSFSLLEITKLETPTEEFREGWEAGRAASAVYTIGSIVVGLLAVILFLAGA